MHRKTISRIFMLKQDARGVHNRAAISRAHSTHVVYAKRYHLSNKHDTRRYTQ